MSPMLESRGPSSAVLFPPDSSHFRVAVIGLGNAGHTLHLPALAGMTSATVVGAVDPDPSRRERADPDDEEVALRRQDRSSSCQTV